MNLLDHRATLEDMSLYLHDEERCLELFASWRWPYGFRCPRSSCTSRKAYRLRGRPVWQCAACRRHVRPTAGTVLHGTHLPLRYWLYAIWMVAGRKQSISALQLQRDLGIGSYESAWLLLHKVRFALVHEQLELPLHFKRVDVDTVQLAPSTARSQNLDGIRPDSVAFSWQRDRADDFMPPEDCYLLEDFNSSSELEVRSATSSHIVKEAATVRPGTRAVRVVLGNFVDWLRGTFHGVSRKYLRAYVKEFRFRLVHRDRLKELPRILAWRLMWGRASTRLDLRAFYASLRPRRA